MLLSLPLQLLIIQIIADKSVSVETYYTFGFYKSLSHFLRFIFGSTSFPVGQLLFYSLVGFLVYWLFTQVQKIFHKQVSLSQFLRIVSYRSVAFLSGFYFLFTLMWGLNYHRRPIQEITRINSDQMNGTELVNLCRKLILLTNESRKRVSADETKPLKILLSQEQILKQALAGYQHISKIYPELTYSRPAVKSVLVPELMSFFGIGGIYFPFTGEANVNMDPPAFLLPETVCHEMAHQIGVASEDEANFVAYLVCRYNPEPAFQYSANYSAMKYAMNRLHFENPDLFEQFKKTLSPGVQQDLEANKKYWESFKNPIEVVSDTIHDLFLKANDQEEGIRSYSRVVELLLGEYRKNGLDF